MSNTTFMGFYGSWNLLLTLKPLQINISHFVVKRRVLVVCDQDIQTLPNFIDFCIQVTQIWSYLDYLMRYCMPAESPKGSSF